MLNGHCHTFPSAEQDNSICVFVLLLNSYFVFLHLKYPPYDSNVFKKSSPSNPDQAEFKQVFADVLLFQPSCVFFPRGNFVVRRSGSATVMLLRCLDRDHFLCSQAVCVPPSLLMISSVYLRWRVLPDDK